MFLYLFDWWNANWCWCWCWFEPTGHFSNSFHEGDSKMRLLFWFSSMFHLVSSSKRIITCITHCFEHATKKNDFKIYVVHCIVLKPCLVVKLIIIWFRLVTLTPSAVAEQILLLIEIIRWHRFSNNVFHLFLNICRIDSSFVQQDQKWHQIWL